MGDDLAKPVVTGYTQSGIEKEDGDARMRAIIGLAAGAAVGYLLNRISKSVGAG